MSDPARFEPSILQEAPVDAPSKRELFGSDVMAECLRELECQR